jgi:hypothetical protein
LIEEQRTNSIRNNTMQGAVAGTPGTLPTNWIIPTPINGLARQIVGTGTENGITYIDVKYSGTTSAGGLTAIYWESVTGVAATSGQTWTNSVYVALVGGSTANTTGVVVGIDENNAAGGFLAGSSTAFVPSAGALTEKRVSHTRTLTNASTAFVRPYVFFSYGNGAAIDITLRIGMPQLELGAFATSVISTTTAEATRAADVGNQTGANFSNWFDATKGTLFVEYSAVASGIRTIAAMNDGTANESIRLRTDGTNPLFTVTDGGVDQANIDAGTVATGTVYRFAGAYAANDFAASINGGAAVTDTSGTLPTVNRLMIGNSSSSNYLNGHVRRLAYFPRRLSDAELTAITS